MAGAADIGIRIFLDNAASAGLNQINAQLGQMGTLANRSGNSLAQMSAKTAVNSGVMLGVAASFGLFAVAIKYSLDAASEFEQSMFSVAVATHVSLEEAMKYSNVLMDLGASSTYTSAEIAQGIAVLGRSGYTINDIFTKMTSAGVALGIATRTTAVEGFTLLASAMTAYHAPASEALHYANMLQFAYEHQTGSVVQLTAAMSQITPIASLVGTPLREVAAALDVVGPAMGSTVKAGTAVRYMLSGLIQPTGVAQRQMASLGLITVSSTTPAFVAFADKLMAAGGASVAFVKHNSDSVAGLQNLFKAAQGVGVIPLDANFNQWAISNGMLSNKLYDTSGHAKDLTAILQLLSEKLKGMPDAEKLAVLKNLFSVRGGQGADILLAQMDKYMAYLNQFKTTGDNANGVMKRQEEAMKTLAGASAGLSTSFRDLGVAVGLSFLPMATAFVTRLNEMVSSVRRLAIANPDAASTFLKVGLAVSGVGIAFALVIIAASPIGMLITALVGTFLTVIAVTAIVTAAWTGLMNMFHSSNIFIQILAGIIAGALIGALFALMLSLGSLAFTAAAAFIATIAPALAAGAAWLLAFLPFILIGAVIGLVITGIVLAVMHWGAIAHWLQGVWATVVGWIKTQWGALGAHANTIGAQITNGFKSGLASVVGFFRNIVGQIGAVWNGLGAQLHTSSTNSANGVKNAFSSGWSSITSTVKNAATAVVGSFQWLYAHNYYVQAIVDYYVNGFKRFSLIVSQIVQVLVALVVRQWQDLTTGTVSNWNKLVNAVTMAITVIRLMFTMWYTNLVSSTQAAWHSVTTAVSVCMALFQLLVTSRITAAGSAFSNGLSSMIGAIGNWYNNLNDRVTAAMSGFNAQIRNGIQGAVQWVQNGVNQIQNMINGLGLMLYQAGQNAMQMLANGISSMIGAVSGAAGNAAGSVAKLLGFHSPPKGGPLADSDTYMPNMMKMYASGIQQHTPLVTRAILNVSGSIARTDFSLGGNNPSNMRGGNNTVNVMVDSKIITQLVMNAITGELQMNGQSRMMR